MVTFESLAQKKDRLAVVGLGYVGLPLAAHLSKKFDVVGYDADKKRTGELKNGHDRTGEISSDEMAELTIQYTDDPGLLSSCRLIIVAVPTPIDAFNNPDLSPLITASTVVGEHLAKGSCVAYESTVYPGATEEVCLPLLEKASGLAFGSDFTLGYSPERINPGDTAHSFERIVKVVSASDDRTLEFLSNVYGSVVEAGIFKASSIKVAEAAKVIENTQRDLNIALMNELSMIFDKIGIDTSEVLEAAETKWNFLPFKPGLVGGHCIGVDPYYLTFKAQALNYHPEMILSGRRINDQMGHYCARRAVKMLIADGKQVLGAGVAVLGLTFKENVPDLRNSKVVDIISELKDYGVNVLVHDPLADPEEARAYYGIDLVPFEQLVNVDAVILAVPHRMYKTMGLDEILKLGTDGDPVIMDLKSVFDLKAAGRISSKYWRL
jgi:UDP-N-acetyl-D-glucosamine/UDP-N-acetyl-D-galactosamine dehydrogenase